MSFSFISLLLCFNLGTAAFADEGTHAGPFNFDDDYAVTKWLNTPVASPQYIAVSSQFEKGATIALKRIFNSATSEWNVAGVSHFDYYNGRPNTYPILFAETQISQNPYKTLSVPMNGSYFIEKKTDPTKRLVVNISESSWDNDDGANISIYYNWKGEGQAVAESFLKDFQSEANRGTIYKGGVLEVRETGKIGFLKRVDGYHFTWEDMILEERVKADFRDTAEGFIRNYDHSSWKKYGLPLSRGILLGGPPGTGKSMIGKILISQMIQNAYDRQVTYIHVSARHITTRDAIHNLYNVARALNPTVVFMEDVDLIAGTDRTNMVEVKNELLQQLSGIEPLEGVLTIATSNFAEKLDPALRRSQRLGFHYDIGQPRGPERLALFRLFLGKTIPESMNLQKYADATEGMVGADIKDIVQAAMEEAIRKQSFSESGDLQLKAEHLNTALKNKKETQ